MAVSFSTEVMSIYEITQLISMDFDLGYKDTSLVAAEVILCRCRGFGYEYYTCPPGIILIAEDGDWQLLRLDEEFLEDDFPRLVVDIKKKFDEIHVISRYRGATGSIVERLCKLAGLSLWKDSDSDTK